MSCGPACASEPSDGRPSGRSVTWPFDDLAVRWARQRSVTGGGFATKPARNSVPAVCTVGPMDALTPVTLTTPRLRLLPLRVDHAEVMAVVLGDPALHTFTGGKPLAAHELRTRYARLLAGAPDPRVTWCNWVIEHRHERCPVGTVQATVGPDATEVAWVVGTRWQRQGIAKEAATELVAWLVEQGVREIFAHIHPAHTASAAVAGAAGLVATPEMCDGEVKWRKDAWC